MIVAGVMSGTSADGINVALVRVRKSRRPKTASGRGAIELLGHAEYPYPQPVRAAILAAMNAQKARVADLARLNFLLGELYAEAVLRTQRRFRHKAELIGCHGQTLYHQGAVAAYLGRGIAATWQSGEGAILASRVGVPVVSDFRPADMAAGGMGAPLVPFLDFLLYRDARLGRIVQNIGGIANLTAMPAGATPRDVIAFDTGPGNMLIDALSERLFQRAYDKDGKLAAQGRVIESAAVEVLSAPFFRLKPPKTAGREEFGREFAAQFVRRCGRAAKADMVATATAITARSIADAVRRFLSPRGAFRELIVSGGGAKNPVLMAFLENELRSLGIRLRSSDEFGLPSEAKEAVAFALLANETWHRRAANIPSATGAKRPAVLGKISYP